MKQITRCNTGTRIARQVSVAVCIALIAGCASPNGVRDARTGIDPATIRFQQNGTVQLKPTTVSTIGAGVPLPNNLVLTTRRILESDVYVGAYDCKKTSLSTIPVVAESAANRGEQDNLVLIDADCTFQNTAVLTADRPEPATRVTVTGYPASLQEDVSGCDLPPPIVLNGMVVPRPNHCVDWPDDATVIAVDDIPDLEEPGLLGAACATQQHNGTWAVFGLATRFNAGRVLLPDLEHPQDPPAETDRTWILVSTIPPEWIPDISDASTH